MKHKEIVKKYQYLEVNLDGKWTKLADKFSHCLSVSGREDLSYISNGNDENFIMTIMMIAGDKLLLGSYYNVLNDEWKQSLEYRFIEPPKN